MLRFLILIPHRDCSKALRAYCRSLFASGLPGAWSFPGAIPLAQVSGPFTREELKDAAHKLRGLSIQNERDGKFYSTGTALAQSPGIDAFRFFGIKLGFSKPFEGAEKLPPVNKKVIYGFNTLCLCAALITPEAAAVDRALSRELPSAPGISFRAASIANLSMKPLSTGEAPYSWEWEIGAPVWLPAYKPDKKKNAKYE
ncbi:hypothetical protein TREAZ_1007 [Leadbettera azotonutricia ZAS-9]|uniref:Uncharacterized protein n=2 Tax=Leadbettera azotonutricia TaxID=150829 RepID=F5Y875_LEAAZ|nr:hypothetical protein TREAZ_1007 [Leadbettera azotonutricia ZAS-9]